jgi:hypothetical protein
VELFLQLNGYGAGRVVGKLMALSLLCTMAAAVLFQPVLMGRPRQVNVARESTPDLREAAE